MHFFDHLCGRFFTLGMMASHAFAALLYSSILLLTLYALGKIALHLLG